MRHEKPLRTRFCAKWPSRPLQPSEQSRRGAVFACRHPWCFGRWVVRVGDLRNAARRGRGHVQLSNVSSAREPLAAWQDGWQRGDNDGRQGLKGRRAMSPLNRLGRQAGFHSAPAFLGVQKPCNPFNRLAVSVQTLKAKRNQGSSQLGRAKKLGVVQGRICEVGPPQAVGLTSLARIRTSCSMGILLCEAHGCRRGEG